MSAVPDASQRSPCPHYPDCVGCGLIGTPYKAQLARKRERVQRVFGRHSVLAGLEIPEVVGSPRAFGYRNQAKLVVRGRDGALLLGIYRPGSHVVADISRCPVHDPLINRVLAAARASISRQGVPIYDARAGSGWLRYLVVRASAWRRAAQIILVVRDRRYRGERSLARALARIRRVTSVVINLNADPGNVVFGAAFVPATKETALVERVGGLKLKTHAGSFLQANVPVACRVYERVVAWAEPQPEETAIDLHCGVGAITLSLATRAGRVFGIEESRNAVLDAKENIRLNGFHNVRFLHGAAASRLPDLARDLDRVALITLNPPRKGVDEATREAIVSCRPSRLVYVSCDPESLARDLGWFAARGYRTSLVQPFDMLPQTEHVECVTRLDAE